LAELDISSCKSLTAAGIIQFVNNSVNPGAFTKLSVVNRGVDDSVLDAIATRCSGLTSLNLAHSNITDNALVMLSQCKSLTVLVLAGNFMILYHVHFVVDFNEISPQ
jgi:hypothetical protein